MVSNMLTYGQKEEREQGRRVVKRREKEGEEKSKESRQTYSGSFFHHFSEMFLQLLGKSVKLIHSI